MSSDNFAGIAEKDGIIEYINHKLKLVKVKYDDNTSDIFSFNETYPEVAGIHITQRMELAFNEGERFKRGDIITYNKEFFQANPYNKQVDWKHGLFANTVLMEVNSTLQDSCAISKELGEKLEISPTNSRYITLDKDSLIYEMKKVGDIVNNTDTLIVFEENPIEDTTLNKNADTLLLLKKLNRNLPKSKFDGIIVNIDVYYTCPIEEMHPSLGNIIKQIITKKNALYNFVKDTDKVLKFPKSIPLPKDTRFKGIDFTDNTVVIQFYIKSEITADVGDKLVFDNSLKTVIGQVINEPIITSSGVKVDAIFSGQGINNRIINSPLLIGNAQRVIEKIENDILEIWNS